MKNSRAIPLVDGGTACAMRLRSRATSIPALLLGALVLSACGATNPAPVAHGTLDFARLLPAPTPSPFAAYGAGQGPSDARRSSAARGSISPYLRTPAAKRARATPPSPAPVASLGPATRVAAATTPAETPARDDSQVAARTLRQAEVTLPASKPDTTRTDAERYAARESRELEGYRGGDAIVITASTLVIILLVAVVIFLVT